VPAVESFCLDHTEVAYAAPPLGNCSNHFSNVTFTPSAIAKQNFVGCETSLGVDKT
jgi:hypothetical protein